MTDVTQRLALRADSTVVTGWAFHAVGNPAAQGSKRHVGHGIMVESSRALRPWRDTVTAAAFTTTNTLTGPVACRMVFTLAKPRSARKTERRPWRKPDLGKLDRAVEDSITAAGGWADDAQVVEYHRLAKVWNGHDDEALPVPGVVVAACEITADGDPAGALREMVRRELSVAWSRRPTTLHEVTR